MKVALKVDSLLRAAVRRGLDHVAYGLAHQAGDA
jgi:hypothetical protein